MAIRGDMDKNRCTSVAAPLVDTYIASNNMGILVIPITIAVDNATANAIVVTSHARARDVYVLASLQ